MLKIISCWVAMLFIYAPLHAQEVAPARLSKQDSLDLLRELDGLLAAGKQAAYGLVNVGVGNRLFSIRNNVLNAKQVSTHTIIYSPSAGYFHPTGLSIVGGANILNDGKRFGVTQYSITPSFDLAGNEKVDLGISYTHYFVKNKYNPFSSPIQNDLFASAKLKKMFVQPGVAVGYATGEYKEALHKDTVINGRLRQRYDSISYKLQAFSLMVSAGHRFLWLGVRDQRDVLAVTPTLMCNAGSGRTDIEHRSNVLLINYFIRKGKLPKLQTNRFELQSLGFNFDLNYMIKNVSLAPQVYLDYYLPDTDLQRFTAMFAMNIGYSF